MVEKYINCATLKEALNILSLEKGKVKVLAGGTDLMLEIERGFHLSTEILLDISRIDGLDKITLDDSGWVHFGAMVTHNQAMGSELLHKYAPLLVEACFGVGSPQIRNRGTIAGNLITASPANDTISPLMALDAILTLESERGSRKIRIEEFYNGVRKTKIEKDELLTEISFKALGPENKSIYKKFALRKTQAISLVNASIILKMEKDIISDVNITLGAVAPVIIHAKMAESFLIGKQLTEDNIEKTAELVKEDVNPISDIRSSADYRVKISSVLVKRGLIELSLGSKSIVPDSPVLLWGKFKPNKITDKNCTVEFITDSFIQTKINGKEYSFPYKSTQSLLYLIREEAKLTGTKEGCGEGECGACTIYLDGVAVDSCLVPAARADGAEIITIEGITSEGKLHPVQQAFIDEGAVQCGYCTPGFIMSAIKLLEEKNSPDQNEIKLAITGNLCRCTGYYKIVKAIESIVESE
jgi:xanthine dehydrogenase iron-sulfur cluster and FAD-binding subunit A